MRKAIILLGSLVSIALAQNEVITIPDTLWHPKGYHWKIDTVITHPYQTKLTLLSLALGGLAVGIASNKHQTENGMHFAEALGVGSAISLYAGLIISRKTEVISLEKDTRYLPTKQANSLEKRSEKEGKEHLLVIGGFIALFSLLIVMNSK